MDLLKKKCYVACLDIAGFKKLVEEEQDDLLVSFFEEAKEEKKRFLQNSESNIVMFSDSIFVITKDLSEESYEDVVYSSLIYCKIAFEKGIAINGAISCGDMVYKDSEICFGKALIDAHLLQEKLFSYGVIISDQVLGQRGSAEISNFNFPHTPIIDTKVFLKEDNSKGYVERHYNFLNIGDVLTGYKVSYCEQVPTMRKLIKLLWDKYHSANLRINNYLIHTELSLKAWYDFAGEVNHFDGWGDIICS